VKLGIFGLNTKATCGPAATARLAKRCEELGYDSWWVGEHVVLPSPRVPPAPMEPTDAILDPLVHLAFVAGVTEQMLLGTGIIIVPQRNPPWRPDLRLGAPFPTQVGRDICHRRRDSDPNEDGWARVVPPAA
jgi:hypothetical protein